MPGEGTSLYPPLPRSAWGALKHRVQLLQPVEDSGAGQCGCPLGLAAHRGLCAAESMLCGAVPDGTVSGVLLAGISAAGSAPSPINLALVYRVWETYHSKSVPTFLSGSQTSVYPIFFHTEFGMAVVFLFFFLGGGGSMKFCHI